MNINNANYIFLKTNLIYILNIFKKDIGVRNIDNKYYFYLLILRTVLPYLDKKKEIKILDVGAGGGIIPLTLAKAGYNCSVIDTWEEYSEYYQNNMGIKENIIDRFNKNGIQVKYCDIEKELIPFQDNSFDIVLFLEVIEHLHDSPKKLIHEIRRVLKENGVLILTTPNLANLKNRLYVLIGKSNYTPLAYWYNHVPFFGHIREYTHGEINQMLKWEGLRIKKIHFHNSLQLTTLKSSRFLSRIIMAIHLVFTMLIPKMRYSMIFVAHKLERGK